MNKIEQRLQDLTRGRMTFRSHWVASPVGEFLQHTFPTKSWQKITWAWRLSLPFVPFVMGWLVAQYEAVDPLNVPDPNWVIPGPIRGTFFGLVTFMVLLPLCVYAARHVPVPGHYPDCPKCGRSQESLHAQLEGRYICSGCRKVIRDEINQSMETRAVQRAWRSL